MPFVRDETEESKNRILDVAERLFSEKGFDATRVDEIAKDAGVNKALIYYYFNSKEAILDHLIKTLLDKIGMLATDFIRSSIVTMIKNGQLDILEDRWRFTTEADVKEFYSQILVYYKGIVDFALMHRRVVRILVFESLKNGKHHNDLFRILDLLNNRGENSIFQMIWSADNDFAYTTENIVSKFFFGFVPLFSFAAYFDDYRAASNVGEEELREAFMRAYEKTASLFIHGKEIIL